LTSLAFQKTHTFNRLLNLEAMIKLVTINHVASKSGYFETKLHTTILILLKNMIIIFGIKIAYIKLRKRGISG